MGYCIEYSPEDKKRYPVKAQRKSERRIVTLLAFVVIITLFLACGGNNILKQVLLPGDPEITAAAVESMMDNLGAGESLYDSFTVFCKEIIDGAMS